ncbi:MAG TPA: hydrogenase maturation protease [bacterium]
MRGRARRTSGTDAASAGPAAPLPAGRVLVVGMGNTLRGDDAAGVLAARRIRSAALPGVEILEAGGALTELLDAWAAHEHVVLIDAVASGARPGTIHRLAVSEGPVPAELRQHSTHGMGVADAIELARAMRRLPARVMVYGIEGDCFDPGAPVTPAVRRASAKVAGRILRDLACPSAPPRAPEPAVPDA